MQFLTDLNYYFSEGANLKRTLGSIIYGTGGVSASLAIHANGKELSSMPAESLTTSTPTSLSLVDILFPELVAEGTITIVNGKMFFLGLAVSDMISITLGLISLMLIVQRVVVDFWVAAYKRKALKETEDLKNDLQ